MSQLAGATTSVSIGAADLGSGQLPRVCFRTGEPADGNLQTRIRNTPAWVVLIVIMSLMLGLIVALAVSKTVTARLPATSSVRGRYVGARIVSLGLIVGGVLVLLVGGAVTAITDAVGIVVLLGLLMFFIGALVMLLLVPRFGARGKILDQPGYGRYVVLERVHPEFARAVADWYAERSAAAASAVQSSVGAR